VTDRVEIDILSLTLPNNPLRLPVLLVRLLNGEGDEGVVATPVVGLRRMNEFTPSEVNTLVFWLWLCIDDGMGGAPSRIGVLGYDLEGEDLQEDGIPSTWFEAAVGLSTTRENLKSFSGRL